MSTADYNLWHREAYKTDISRAVKQNRRYYELVSRALGLDRTGAPPERLLDVPCGKGDFLSFLESRTPGIARYGLDISDYAVKQAAGFVRAELVVGDAERLPYPEGFFDYLVSLGGLEYYRDPARGVKEMSRVLAPSGQAFIHVPNLMFLGHVYLCFRDGRMPSEGGGGGRYYRYESERFCTFQGWKDLIEGNGLAIAACSAYNLIGGSTKVSPPLRFLYHRILRHAVPFHLSYNFIFRCTKATGSRANP